MARAASDGELLVVPELRRRRRERAKVALLEGLGCITFCVSQSAGDTGVFGDGRLLMTIERAD